MSSQKRMQEHRIDQHNDQSSITASPSAPMSVSVASLTTASHQRLSRSANVSPTVSRRPSRHFPRSLTVHADSPTASHRFTSLPRRLANNLRHRRSLFSHGPDEDGGGTFGSMRSRPYDDPQFQQDMQETGAGTGVRVWYESYTTIDWIHDAIKESSRLRRLRALRGYRGALLNAWDRLQGWLIVTITGIITALIAGGIVKSEAVLFDLKEGYCGRDWRLAKRFCCPFGDQPDWDGGGGMNLAVFGNASRTVPEAWHYRTRFMTTQGQDPSKGLLTGMGNRMLAGWAAPVAGSPVWSALAAHQENENCPGWISWADRFHLHGRYNFLGEYGIYVGVALLWASIASLLTIYLTSSELYTSRRARQATPPPSFQQSPQQKSRLTSTAKPHRSRTSTFDGARAEEQTPLLADGHGVSRARYDGQQANEAGSRSDANPLPHKLLAQMAGEVRAREALPPRKILYFGSGSGISEVKCILSGFVVHGYLGFWTLFTKSVGLALSVASGLSLGKEGPFVHIASCVGNITCRVFPKYEKNESKRREILSCACAAGVAVAFGAPVGGVLFSLEEVSYYFSSKVMFRSFFCAMVAAATLRFLDPFGTGKIVLFQVTYDRDWHWIEAAFFIVLGIFGGLYGALFTRLNMLWSKRVRATTWMARHPLCEVMLITTVTVLVSFLNDYTRMGGPELIADLFSECHEHESLEGLCVSRPSQIGPLITSVAWAMVTKGALTVITFGLKLPAGIFIPSLCVGACFGRIVGLFVQYVQWTRPDLSIFQWCQADTSSACIVPGVYAMVGAAASLSGVTRSTISLVVIMFELTGTLTYAVPVMLSVLVARTIADGLESKGIYDLVMEFSGLPYLDPNEQHTWQGVSILDCIDTGVETISLDQTNTVQSLRLKLQRLALVSGNPDGGFPIVVEAPSSAIRNGLGLASSGQLRHRLVGYIAAQELEHGLERLMAPSDDDDDDYAVDAAQQTCTFDYLPRPTEPASTSASTHKDDDGEDEDEESGQCCTPMTMDSAAPDGERFMRDSTLLAALDAPTHDLSLFVDRAPLTLTTASPLELVQQMFTKLGVRYIVVLHATDGTFKGVIFKKRWLAFLHALNEGEKHI